MTAFDPKRPFPYQAIVDRPPVRWPGGARVAVWIVPNIEHYRIDIGPGTPDVRNHARRDFGNRVGVWRLMETMAKHGVRGSVALNGEVVEHYPRIIEECAKLNWELMGHGMTNSQVLRGVTLEEEIDIIARTKAAIESCGQTMRGWLGPGLTETWHTLGLLREHGVEYVADWCNDDLPYVMDNGLYALPYSLELNDMPLFNTPSISITDFERRIRDTFDTLYAEGAKNGRAMCIALHPYLIGAAHRIKYLDRALGYIMAHDGVWFATGSEIVDAYKGSMNGL
jgi:peptidoglycan/xylan/chitin deacetylase (PgdA/CDA1 family)